MPTQPREDAVQSERPISPSPGSETPFFAIAAAVAVLAVAGYFGWPYLQRAMAPETPSTEAAAPAAPPAEAAPAEPPVAAAEPAGPEHPLDEVEDEAATAAPDPTPLPSLDEADPLVSERIAGLLGQKNVLTFLQVDGFVRRVVASVDNLTRTHAPPAVWPVQPTPERFATLKGQDGAETIHPDNGQRYAPLVRMIEAVDTGRAVALYRGLYPLFQQAYEELGYPGRYFNDRLVQVLDHLIATPMQTEPLAVHLVEVKGTVPSLRPWVRYEFADPALASLSAGQKMLLRMGPDNHQRLQAKLQEVRQRVSRR